MSIQTGSHAMDVENFGFYDLEGVSYNLDAPWLYEEALTRDEAVVATGGALAVDTGVHTGRSPQDKFIVRDAATGSTVWWGGNNALAPHHFQALQSDFLTHARGKHLFVQDLYAGADCLNRVSTRVVTEFAWQSLFIRNLLIRPPRDVLWGFSPELTIVDFPTFRADPARHGCRSETIIALDLSRGIVLIGGTSYAGEIKKAVFTYLNHILPPRTVLPMHCSANIGADEKTAIFFGLSGTGKTTLSADPARTLIGDDEHGWGPRGVFNFEGGCYAKAIHLSRNAEPEIYATTERFGTVMENVVLHPLTGDPDFNDDSKTENTRVAYPLDFIPNALASGCSGHPSHIVMLTCDAFGVLPPIARLSAEQAMYHFLSGYTAKVAGTEKGLTEPEATFSTCFGQPFLPRYPVEYGNLLRDLIARHGTQCWLLNTGWSGGKVGTGQRMPLRVTRTLLSAALDGTLLDSPLRTDPYFGLSVPTCVRGVDSRMLNPVETWSSAADFEKTAQSLVSMFDANFARFAPFVAPGVRDAKLAPTEIRDRADA
jgi:phosphoenolpyruvate carboxykinase (ATP)